MQREPRLAVLFQHRANAPCPLQAGDLRPDCSAWEGRETKPDLKLGICGEHGGDPESIHFFHESGLDYVSCSPFRVPVARLEAGRAQVMESQGNAG